MQHRRFDTIVILGMLMAFAPMAIDMYLPAFPTLKIFFEVDAAKVQVTLAAFFVGFALGQAFYGPFADRFGRKPPLYFGLVLFFGTSIACAYAPSIEALIVLRFFQGVGACANGVVARAMVRDLYEPRDAAKVFSLLTLVFGVAPVVAPMLGSYILEGYGWREIFLALAAFGFVSFVATLLRLPESRPTEAIRPLRLGSVLSTYWQLLIHRRYLGAVLAGGVSLAGLFAYISGSSFVVIELYGVTPQGFAWLFGANAVGLVVTAQINARLVRHFQPETLVLAGFALQTIAGAALVFAGATGAGDLYGIAVPLFVYVSCIGIVMPNATALAMAPFPQVAGAASALLGTLQFGLAAISSSLVGAIYDGSAIPMASVILGCGVLSFVIFGALAMSRGVAHVVRD